MTSPPAPEVREGRPPGLRVATVRGVPVYVGGSWVVLALLIVVLVGGNLSVARPDLGLLVYGVAALYAVLLLVAVLVHEAAHALAARRFGLPVHRVVADLWGGHTAYDPTGSTAGSSAVVAVVGPLANAALAGVAWVLEPSVPPGVPSGLVASFAFLNGALAVFNLLPGLPLDGGQLVEAAVWGATGNRNRGKVVAGWAGRVVAVLVLAWFVGVPLATGGGFDLSYSVWFFLIAGFLWAGATSAIRQGAVLDRISRVSLGRLIRPATEVAAGTPLERALALPDIPVVVDGLRRPVALLSTDAVDSVPEAARAYTPVDAVTQPQPTGWAVDADPTGDLLPVVRVLQDTRASVAAVTWQGRLVGVVTAADVNSALGEN